MRRHTRSILIRKNFCHDCDALVDSDAVQIYSILAVAVYSKICQSTEWPLYI